MNHTIHRIVLLNVILALMFIFVGCSAKPRNAVPAAFAYEAVIPGMPGVRTWGGMADPAFQQDIADSIAQVARAGNSGTVDAEGYVNLLAISGGSSDGAYGVGLMAGWSKCTQHPRPKFKIVTGVSTGALTAPFFFAGPEWDPVISKLYTTVAAQDIYRRRNIMEVLFNPEAITSTEPLAKKLEEYITPKLLEDVAKGHAEGRRLYVATTNLDALRLTVWDMGKIASLGTPESATLFRKVLLASASVPAVFPPVKIGVVADGKHYEEIHADGGVQSQVFLLGFALDLSRARKAAGIDGRAVRTRVYVIRNAQLRLPYDTVPLSLGALAGRSISGLISSQGNEDLKRIHSVATKSGMDFRLACIPDDFPRTTTVMFDTAEMNRLYDLAYAKAVKGYPWLTTPPVVAEDITTAAPDIQLEKKP